jgi:hypothetical protein
VVFAEDEWALYWVEIGNIRWWMRVRKGTKMLVHLELRWWERLGYDYRVSIRWTTYWVLWELKVLDYEIWRVLEMMTMVQNLMVWIEFKTLEACMTGMGVEMTIDGVKFDSVNWVWDVEGVYGWNGDCNKGREGMGAKSMLACVVKARRGFGLVWGSDVSTDRDRDDWESD